MGNEVTTHALEKEQLKSRNGSDTAVIVKTLNDGFWIYSEFSVSECSNACIVVS